MSHTFSVGLHEPPPAATLVAGLGLADLAVRPEDGDLRSEPIRFWREGISTRATEVRWLDGRLDVRVNSLASIEDAALAVSIVRIAADFAGTHHVESESAGEIPAVELGQLYGAEWAMHLAESGARAVCALIADGRGPIQVPGPLRSYHLGPRTLAGLQSAGPAGELHVRLLAAIRKVQWVDPEVYPAAGVFSATSKTDDAKFTFAVWMGQPVLFPAVERALLDPSQSGSGESVFLIRSEQVPALAGTRWTWLDERQGTIEGYEPAQWDEFVASARGHAL